MARISDIVVHDASAQYVLTVRKTIDFMAEFDAFSTQGFDRITRYLADKGRFAAGAPIVCFHNMDLAQLDVEVGFPVAAAMPGEGDIRCAELPAQRVVTTIDQGPYEEQDATLEALFQWIGESPYEMTCEIYYQYLNTPDRPASEYLTKMLLPVYMKEARV